MGLAAGRLDRRVRLMQARTVKNALNEDVVSWVTLATVYGSKTDVSDGERVRAAEVAAVITTRFVVRYSMTTRQLTPRDRVVLDGLVYDIVGIKEVGRREGLEITANARPDVVVG